MSSESLKVPEYAESIWIYLGDSKDAIQSAQRRLSAFGAFRVSHVGNGTGPQRLKPCHVAVTVQSCRSKVFALLSIYAQRLVQLSNQIESNLAHEAMKKPRAFSKA